MDRKDANAWVSSVIVGLLPSQINTLADLVGAALALARVSLARECSDFLIGQSMLDRMQIPSQRLFKKLTQSILDASPNWG